ncbi:hypothetical protein PR001_g20286 [Phytophthora rubi]|uniref:Uncharacterized protein n=1 Tax=Phytophthora rubi TaxID=129364 RepID=A0A6A3JIC1_9STRA|nr:hypothetical protein PR001_g20286 [Phytophthora rubi]
MPHSIVWRTDVIAPDMSCAAGRTDGTNRARSPSFKGVMMRPTMSSPQGKALSAMMPNRGSGLHSGSFKISRNCKLVFASFQLPGQLCLLQTMRPSAEKHNVPATYTT